MCCSFKEASHSLCHSLALLARHLCTQFIHPSILAFLLACRLVTLDKNPGVRPMLRSMRMHRAKYLYAMKHRLMILMYAWAKDSVKYIDTMKCKFVHFSPCKCTNIFLMYVHAKKDDFVHDRCP